MLNLDSDISKITSVGEKTANKLERLGLKKVKDLLFYFPFRYDDFSRITPIEKLKIGEKVNIVGQIDLIQNKRSFKKRISITEALVSDETETIKVIWFNQPFIARNLKVGNTVSLSGKIEDDYGGLMMNSPIYEKVSSNSPVHTQGLVPNYHLTSNITQKQIRFIIKKIIHLAEKQEDWLPENIIQDQKLISLSKAIINIHFPENKDELDQSKKRLAFNELFLIQLQSQLLRKDIEAKKAISIAFVEQETKKFVEALPFKLTNAQKKSAWEIIQDLENNKPMTRLLEGDVGSGKTVVACLAMMNVALNNFQSVLMVPTEILAKQHFDSITKLFANIKLKIGLITRSNKLANFELLNNTKKEITNEIAKKSQIIIGTHALIQEKLKFNNLALAIIDEQHRFGVEQRKILMEKSGDKRTTPHFLSMTATPIPRSLALALYGDLKLSVINEMPRNRKPIITKVISENNRNNAYGFINEQIKQGRQIFVICPLIDISDPLRLSESETSKLGIKSVKEEFKKLNQQIFPHLNIAFLHGRMKPKEKDKIMQDFLDNKIKILVSTSVVEVGIDVPNATIMMIEGADRFGLAQLHQFRGRVGRSEFQSYCFLFTDNQSGKTKERLEALTKYNDGLSLAKVDLKFRGPGEVYGTIQKGFPELKMASLFDFELMKQAQHEAKKILENNSDLKKWPILDKKIKILNINFHPE